MCYKLYTVDLDIFGIIQRTDDFNLQFKANIFIVKNFKSHILYYLKKGENKRVFKKNNGSSM